MRADLEALKTDASELQRWVDLHGGILPAARAAGVTREWMRYYCDKLGVRSPRKPGQTLRAVQPQRDDQDPRSAALLTALRRGATRLELADLLDVSPRRVDAMIEELQGDGYRILERGDRLVLDVAPAPSETVMTLPESDRVRIAVLGDTHLGSKTQQLTHLRDAYQRIADRGIRHVYHVGDLIDGEGLYRGHEHEVFVHGFDDQVAYAVEHYPRVEGVTTYVIGGNHDLAYVKRAGADPLAVIARDRPDIEYLGPWSAWVRLSAGALAYLLHPDGGGSYALSYRLQKTIGSFEDGRKPHLAFLGHWHTRAYVFVRNVHGWLTGCFQAQTDYQRRKALQPTIGATLIDLRFDDDGQIHELQTEYLTYLVPKERDWE